MLWLWVWGFVSVLLLLCKGTHAAFRPFALKTRIGVSACAAIKTSCGILWAVLGPVFGEPNNVFILEQVQGKTGRVISRTENLS